MRLTPEQNYSILISLGESLVAAPERREKFFAITQDGPGESPTLTKYVNVLRSRFQEFGNGTERQKLDRIRAIAGDLQQSPDTDEKLVGATLSALVDRYGAL